MKIQKNQKREMTLSIDNSLSDDENRTVLLAFSSETPVTRNIAGQEFNEILLHGTENVSLERLNSGAALLFNHNMDDHIGIVESATIDNDHVARAFVRFSSVGLGAEKFAMVQERTLQKVSVGYSILDYEIRGEDLLVTRWEPYEISMVTVPADNEVGIGRSLETDEVLSTESDEVHGEIDEHTDSNEGRAEEHEITSEEKETINNTESEPEQEVQDEDENERRIDEINAISRAFTIADSIRDEAIKSGLSIDGFKRQIMNKNITVKDDENMENNFSLNTLMRNMLDGQNAEAEFGKNGVLVKNGDFIRAGVTTTTAKDVIHTDVLYGSFIDVLRAQSVLKNFPVQMYTGLTSEIALPKLSGDFTQSFGPIAENGVSPEVDANFESVVLKPVTYTGSVPLSRSVVKTCPQIEQIVSQAIVTGFATRLETIIMKAIVDAAVAAGNVKTIDAYDYGTIVEAQGELGDEGVLFSNISAVMAPSTKAKLRSTLRGANTAAVYLFDDGDLCGVPAYDSKVLAGAGDFVILGDFSKVAIGQWGDAIELDMDDTTNRNRGSVIARVWADIAFALTNPEAFRVIKIGA